MIDQLTMTLIPPVSGGKSLLYHRSIRWTDSFNKQLIRHEQASMDH